MLRDCYRAATELERTELSTWQWRLRWINVVTLLRATGHVLKQVDGKRSPFLSQAIKNAWTRWESDKYNNLIFHEFIKKERDMILKEYKIVQSTIRSVYAENDVADTGMMLLGDRVAVKNELVRDAIRWWEVELTEIEEEAASLKKTTKTSGRRVASKQ